MNRSAKIAVACSLLAVTACETLDSADIRTSGVYAEIDVEADGTGQSVVRTTLRSGGAGSNTYLELTAGDRLLARSEGQTKTMAASRNVWDEVHYVAGFSRDAGGTEFRVAFERPSENGEDADDSRVSLPDPFRLVSPAPGGLVRPDEDRVRIEWDRTSNDRVEVRLEGDCIWTYERVLEDDRGGLVLQPGDLEPHGEESCRVEVTVARVRRGELDANFGEGGRIEARQVRRTWLVVRPR
jgi:hypothetical protein